MAYPDEFLEMPEQRIHDCHNVNLSRIPVAWVIHDKHGPQVETTDAYGGGTIMSVNYCPWCGELLATQERLAKLGKTNRSGIVTGGSAKGEKS